MRIGRTAANRKGKEMGNYKTDGKLINCANYFCDIGKNNLINALEAGETVRIYIDCIGHTRAFMVGCEYESWLKEHYGKRLSIAKNSFGETTYSLK